MRTRLSLVCSFVLIVSLIGCTVPMQGGKSPIKEHHGEQFYTQVNMWAEDGEHIATNYSRGRFIPLNTRVVITSSSSETIRFRIPDMNDRTIRIVNEPEYTKKNVQQLFKRYFGEEKVDLGGFSEAERDAIRNGNLQPGMAKEAVLLARGYPPLHQTPSLESDRWKYWRSRFNTILVHFENDKVEWIKN